MSDKPELGETITEEEEIKKAIEQDAAVAAWMKNNVKEEMQKLAAADVKALPITVKNTGIIREGNKIINRVELDTGFDLNKVKQIMTSPEVPCEMKENYVYVLLFTNPQMPFIIPYLFDKTLKNDLSEWVFINSQGVRVRHKVKNFRQL